MPQSSLSAKSPSERTAHQPALEPSVQYRDITFSDGSTIQLDPEDVVVFVGPNNAGKSRALHELQQRLKRSHRSRVIRSANLNRSGTLDQLIAYIKKHSREHPKSPGNYHGYGFGIHISNLKNWPQALSSVSSLFCMHLNTITRITGSDPPNSISVIDEAPTHPIHMLYEDHELEERIAKYFMQAFGEDLIVHRSAGRLVPLLVGRRHRPPLGESQFTPIYWRRQLEIAEPLSEQGDGMRSFATVILHLLAPTTPSILMLDEPEAFLHPPQARLLGQLIAKHRSSRAQLFVATHSADVLNGLLQVVPDKLRLLRIRRKGNTNHVTELDKKHAKAISSDTLMRYSSVLSGVFHERVVICESDSDCLFYSSLLELPAISGEQQPNVHFVHGGGKDRLAPLAKALTRLAVPVDVIADIDVVRDTKSLRDIVESINGDWSVVESLVERIQKSVAKRRVGPPEDEVRRVRTLLHDLRPGHELPDDVRAKLLEIAKKPKPWNDMKKHGSSIVPRGQETEEFNELCRLCGEIGLWIVPVGEMEGFHRSIGGHGPSWVRKILEECDLASDPALERARKFVSAIWAREV